MLIMGVIQQFYGHGQTFRGVVSYMSAIRRQFCIEKSHWEFEFCPLSGIKKGNLFIHIWIRVYVNLD